MTSSYYDVVVVGADLAPLCCAALLAKRGFRVLVLDQGAAVGSYRLGPHDLPYQPFVLHAHATPVAERVLGELGLSQALRRATHPLDPAFQLAMPAHRLDVKGDSLCLERELDREFPTTKRPILDFHERAKELAAASDRLFATDAAWPPEGYWARRRAAGLAVGLPFEREGPGPDLFAELPSDHPMRGAILAMAAFASDGAESPPAPLALARLYANACREPVALERGFAGLSELLAERIRAHSGALELADRVGAIVARRAGPLRVTLAGSGNEIAAGFVVAGIDVAALLRLLPDRAPFEELFDRQGEPQVRAYRYTLNAVVRRGALPEALGHDLYRIGDPRLPSWLDEACHVQRIPLDATRELACVEALLPARRVEGESGYLEGMRERLLEALGEIAPFLREGLVCVDSPHDGRPPDVLADEITATLDPSDRRGPATMTTSHGFPVTSWFGACAMPVRTPLRRLLLCNRQVLPALGVEGQLLAATSAARIVSRSDRGREWMRRGLWNRARP